MADIIKVWIQEKVDALDWLLIDEKDAMEISDDIYRIDAIKVWLYSGASAKIALDRSEGYEWKNIWILLY